MLWKDSPRVIRSAFHCAEYRFGEGVALLTLGLWNDLSTQFFKPALQGGIAVVRREDLQIRTPPTDPLPQVGPAHKIRGDLGACRA